MEDLKAQGRGDSSLLLPTNEVHFRSFFSTLRFHTELSLNHTAKVLKPLKIPLFFFFFFFCVKASSLLQQPGPVCFLHVNKIWHEDG